MTKIKVKMSFQVKSIEIKKLLSIFDVIIDAKDVEA